MKKFYSLFLACGIFLLLLSSCGSRTAADTAQSSVLSAAESEAFSAVESLKEFNQALGCQITRFETAEISGESYALNADKTAGEYRFTVIDSMEEPQGSFTLHISKAAAPTESSQSFDAQSGTGHAEWQQGGLHYALDADCPGEELFFKWLAYLQTAAGYTGG